MLRSANARSNKDDKILAITAYVLEVQTEPYVRSAYGQLPGVEPLMPGITLVAASIKSGMFWNEYVAPISYLVMM